MKKILAVALLLCMIINLSSCSFFNNLFGKKGAETTAAPKKVLAVTADDVALLEPNQVLYDKDGVKITTLAFNQTALYGPELKIRITNTSEKNIGISADSESINDVMMSTMFFQAVDTGKEADASITFDGNDFKKTGISVVKAVCLSFSVIDAATFELYDKSDILTVYTNALTVETAPNTEGTSAYNADGVKIVLQELEVDTAYNAAELNVFIENKADRKLSFSADEITINGKVVPTMFFRTLSVGKCTFAYIAISESALSDNDITKITEITVSFDVQNGESDSSNPEVLFTTDPVTVTFE